MQDIILSPSDFVAVLNQTLEIAFPVVAIEGELANFRISKNRWVYFDLVDEQASVKCFGTVYQLPGPLEDGMTVRVVGQPRMHPRFGFSVNLQSILPVGEGSLKKAADLLAQKLEAEGLFAPERKRLLPIMPDSIGLITAAGSAAYSDFIKILNERWGGVEVWLADVFVQGEQSPGQLVSAIEYFNRLSKMPEVLVITRGGGGAEDLASFSDERVVRAVAASRIPTLVAVGHEVDVSLAELAADMRASTPTNAAAAVVPDKKHELSVLTHNHRHLAGQLQQAYQQKQKYIDSTREYLVTYMHNLISREAQELVSLKKLSGLLDPKAALRRGYAIVSFSGRHIKSVKSLKIGAELGIELADGKINASINEVSNAR